jgi:TonB family protein
MLAVSLVGHAVLIAVMIVNPSSNGVTLPGVVSVELVAASAVLAPAARAKPAPKPVQKKVVLPAEPTTPKAKPKPKPVEAKVPPEPTTEPDPVEQDISDVLAQLRADAGENAEAPVDTAMAGAPSGPGQLVSPEVAAWLKKAKIHVRQAWVLPPAFRTQALQANVLVDLDAEGNVIGTPRLVRKSGNPWYDEGVVRAIQKASPLPPPPAADEWAFVFVPGDSY